MKKILFILFLVFILVFQNVEASWNYYYDDYEKYEKVVRINTFSEKLSYYEKWEKIAEFDVSTWDDKNQTPSWRFRVMNKSELMWSKSSEKWMPHWIEFYNWKYWIHWFPLNKKKEVIKDENEYIWFEDSWGCVRLLEDNIKQLYNWVDYGTVVLIAYDLNEYSSEDNSWKAVVENYFQNINDKNYIKAYNLKKYKRYSYETFLLIYNNIEVKNISIVELENWKYMTTVDLYKNGVLIKSWVKSIFYIWWWFIVKSFVVN